MRLSRDVDRTGSSCTVWPLEGVEMDDLTCYWTIRTVLLVAYLWKTWLAKHVVFSGHFREYLENGLC